MKKFFLISATLLSGLFFTSCGQDALEKEPALYQKVNYDGWNTSWDFFDVDLISCYGTTATKTVTATLRITPKEGCTSISFSGTRNNFLVDNSQSYDYENNIFDYAKYFCTNEATTIQTTAGSPVDVTFKFAEVPTNMTKIKRLTFNSVNIVFNGHSYNKWFEICAIPYYPISDVLVWN